MIGFTPKEIAGGLVALGVVAGGGVGAYHAAKAVLPDEPTTLGTVGAGVGGLVGFGAALKAIQPGGLLGHGSFGATRGVKIAAVIGGPVLGALLLGNLLD